VDDDLIDEILGIYQRVRADTENADEETLAELILLHLADFEILDVAGDALTGDFTGVDPTRDLALRRLRELVHSFKTYHSEE
jgi:hypothetical protein